MSYLPFTKNGHNMFEVSSLIQKAIRRKDMEYACYAAREMMFKYRSYLWKRMIVVTAEDCFDLVTRPIFILRQRDEECGNINETKHISQAVNLLVNTRKNRDADFFACNLLNSKNKWNVCPDGDGYLVTRHGHDLKTMATLLKKTILNAEDELCGYIGNEIRNWYLGLFWSIVRDAARELGYPSVMREVDVLWTIDMSKPVKDTTFIYAAKALTILMRVAKEGNADFYQMFDVHKYVDISVFDNYRNIPEYTFDCHTIKGKQRGLTDADFIVSEQAALNPLQRGWYDERDWGRDQECVKNGYGNDFSTPKIPKDVLDSVNRGVFPTSLFDL